VRVAIRTLPTRYIELTGDDHYPFVSNVDELVDYIEPSSPGFTPGKSSTAVTTSQV
jgi:hypothetical protein